MNTHADLLRAETAVIEEAIDLIKSTSWTVGTNVRRQSIDRNHYIALGEACIALQGLRMSLDGDGAHNRTDTSVAASKLPGKDTLRRQVLNVLLVRFGYEGDGMTTDAVEQRLNRPHTSVSSAMNFLLRHKLIEDSGLRRDTRAGSPATVYAPTELAREMARKNLLAGDPVPRP